jgi:hypothetical protein
MHWRFRPERKREGNWGGRYFCPCWLRRWGQCATAAIIPFFFGQGYHSILYLLQRSRGEGDVLFSFCNHACITSRVGRILAYPATSSRSMRLMLRGMGFAPCALLSVQRWSCHTAKKIPFMYSFSGNCAASAPNFHIHVSVIYIPRICPHIFLQQNSQTWKYINLSQIYECRHWETEYYNSVLEITVSFLGIHKWEPDIYVY